MRGLVLGCAGICAWAVVSCASSSAGDGPIGTARQAVTSAVPVDAPAIDWASIGQHAPTPIAVGQRAPGDPLPHADVVVITWTPSEWSALDHVFLNSTAARSPTDKTWQTAWPSYTRNASSFTSSPAGGQLWGTFQLVQVLDASMAPVRVLLFKCNAHLSFQPWLAGLRAMLQNILADTTPTRLYSIGTAGGARLDQKLGDSVVTNAAFLQATLPDNANDPANGKTFTSSALPALTLEPSAQKLMFPLSNAATAQDLQTLFTSVLGSASGLTASDLVEGPLTNLGSPTVHALENVPLNTSDDFGTSSPGAGMAPGDGGDPYSAYETDDAVVAQAAIAANVQYASIRNISDPVVPSKTTGGTAITDAQRTTWASALYYRYGFLTAVNGAIATWAAIAGGTGEQVGGADGGAALDGGATTDSDGGPGTSGASATAPSGGSTGGCSVVAPSRRASDAGALVLAGLALVATARRLVLQRRRRDDRRR